MTAIAFSVTVSVARFFIAHCVAEALSTYQQTDHFFLNKTSVADAFRIVAVQQIEQACQRQKVCAVGARGGKLGLHQQVFEHQTWRQRRAIAQSDRRETQAVTT